MTTQTSNRNLSAFEHIMEIVLTYKLYGNHFSGHSYKVAMMLAITRTSFELIPVDLSVSRAERSSEFQRDSRFLEVPVLVDDRLTICQSNQILTYLSQKLGKLEGSTQQAKLSVGEWLFWESNRIGFSIANLRFYRHFRASFPVDLEQFLNARAFDDLSVLENALSRDSFLVGSFLTIADLSCSGYLFWLNEAGFDLKDWPNIRAWLQRISAEPGWERPEVLLTAK